MIIRYNGPLSLIGRRPSCGNGACGDPDSYVLYVLSLVVITGVLKRVMALPAKPVPAKAAQGEYAQVAVVRTALVRCC